MNVGDRPLLIVSAAAYFLVVAAIGVWAARRTRTSRDFFIAGQRIGLSVTSLATMSAAFSGFVFLGGPGLTYRLGLGSLMIVLPLGFTGGMLCWVVARKLRLLAGVREIFTVADLIQVRYRSRWASGLAASAVALGSVAYLGLQFQALAILLHVWFGPDHRLTVLAVGLAVLVLYSIVGGMVAGVYTDVVQGTLMLAAAVAIFVQALRVTGGWQAMTGAIRDSGEFGPGFLDPLGRAPVLTLFGFFFVFGVGVLGQPHMLHKFFMLDDPRKLRFMPLTLGAGQAICVLIWLGIGLAVPALVAGGAMARPGSPDEAAPAFLLSQVPDAVAGLALAGILAAIMSTADSFLNIGSAALVRDLPRALGRPVASELRWGRVGVLGVAVLAAALAWSYGDLIALLGTFAFGTFGAALAPAIAVGFNWARVTARAAGASIATGLTLSVALELAAKPSWFGFLPRSPMAEGALPATAALAASFAVLLLVTWCDRGRSGEDLDPEIRRIIEA